MIYRVVSYTDFLPAKVYGCTDLRKLRMRGSHAGLGWPDYITAALAKYGNRQIESDTVLLPTHCRDPGSYIVRHEDLGVKLRVIEFKARTIKGVALNADSGRVLQTLQGPDPTIFYINDLFSIGFAHDLLRVLPKVRKLKNVVGVIAHQHAKPPFKYYGELYTSTIAKAVAPFLERIFRGRHGLIDGFIVINRKTYRYLTEEVGVDSDKVVFQHVGVDYEDVNPQTLKGNESFWEGCEHRIITATLVTRSYGRYVKGVDLLPKIAKALKRLGYKACIMVAGNVIDPELAGQLKESGIRLVGRLPRRRFLEALAAADVYILPARRSLYYGGIGVATIEAMALDRPVVSPVLEHVPDPSVIDRLGVKTPWLDEYDTRKYAGKVAEALGGGFEPRRLSQRFYDVRVMVNNIVTLIKRVASTPS